MDYAASVLEIKFDLFNRRHRKPCKFIDSISVINRSKHRPKQCAHAQYPTVGRKIIQLPFIHKP